MNKNEYLNRQAGRKENGQFTKSALANFSDKLRNMILDLKQRWYTSPKDYGQALANRLLATLMLNVVEYYIHRTFKGEQL